MSGLRARNFAFSADANDPFSLTHLGDFINLPPMNSTYRSMSGAKEAPCAPQSADSNDMRRIYVHDDDRVLLKVVHYGHPSSAGIEIDDNGEWQFKPLCPERVDSILQGSSGWTSCMDLLRPTYMLQVRAAIITCGGLCPGLNDVIRQIVFTLETYGVKEILGIQYGFKGFVDKKYPPIMLTRKIVQRINMVGGSFLGVSRGCPPLKDIVDKLEEWRINMFFVIGGNGSHSGATAIYEQCQARNVKMVVVGIPKTIDNDIQLLDKTFGFDTAVEEAQRAINAAYVEASSAFNGIGIVKLMGRQSGYITMYATIASGQVDIVLIPEVPFVLEGQWGVLEYMAQRLKKNGICVVVIAEGAGQKLSPLEKHAWDPVAGCNVGPRSFVTQQKINPTLQPNFMGGVGATDASGNPILGDVGKWFYDKVKVHFASLKFPIDVKYIDPTYMIRARACNSSDHIFCSILGQNAVHGAFAGYTNITVGVVNTHYCFLPIPEVIRKPRMVDPNSNMYHRCVTTTGQPNFQNQTCDISKSGWSAGSGTKPATAPHPPPDRKKSLQLKLDQIKNPPPSSNKSTPTSPNHGSYSTDGSTSYRHESPPPPCNYDGHKTTVISVWEEPACHAHETGCPMSQSGSSGGGGGGGRKCHDVNCPIMHKH